MISCSFKANKSCISILLPPTNVGIAGNALGNMTVLDAVVGETTVVITKIMMYLLVCTDGLQANKGADAVQNSTIHKMRSNIIIMSI